MQSGGECRVHQHVNITSHLPNYCGCIAVYNMRKAHEELTQQMMLHYLWWKYAQLATKKHSNLCLYDYDMCQTNSLHW